MGDHQAQAFEVFAEEARGFVGHEAVAGAVEAVTAQVQLAVVFARDGVGVGMLGHGLVVGGVEHGDIGQAFEDFLRGADAQQVGGVVQRRQRDAALDGVDDFAIDQHRFAVLFAGAHHAVADGADAALQPVFFQFLQQGADGAGVVGRVAQFDTLFVAVDFKGDVGIGQIEFFGQAA